MVLPLCPEGKIQGIFLSLYKRTLIRIFFIWDFLVTSHLFNTVRHAFLMNLIVESGYSPNNTISPEDLTAQNLSDRPQNCSNRSPS